MNIFNNIFFQLIPELKFDHNPLRTQVITTDNIVIGDLSPRDNEILVFPSV